MNNNEAWLLPEGIEELLPEQAQQLETVRRDLIDQMHSWGYQLVMPPFIDFLDTLLTGMGTDLALQTFTLTDQVSGRQMGIRADMTPQVARLDAHQFKNDAPNRLCYLGTVLRTRPDELAGSRSPMQCGAELYGSSSIESDIEIIRLMLATLNVTGINQVYLDLAHVGIYRGLAKQANLDDAREAELFELLQSKAIPELEALLNDWSLDADVGAMLRALVDLNGDVDVLDIAKKKLAGADKSVLDALENLAGIAEQLQALTPDTRLFIDLAELRGYHYHNGVMFSAYLPGKGQAIAWGGRYDNIGKDFGRARPATGFSTDLKSLIKMGQVPVANKKGIFAPTGNAAELIVAIASLRDAGERVIVELPEQTGSAAELDCDRTLVLKNDCWEVVAL
ncbi:MAG: ATP phosphoribosyltransferase regulatory subunit [Sulfuriflexus sp.]|nr:ATP phosphoribosyltransferase regulatory subunit [Sulfuriflexus sp.]